ncbi:MAG: DedA family protein [Bifidobacterium sp.]|uniref:DedA family protein n=1 Tax=Bifidobacterium fermentum TaxID=3059035 RepID=A0AB39UID0_9BIFI
MQSFLSPEFIVNAAGPWALLVSCIIIFAESGLLIGFFLPGDSLVFLLGMIASSTAMSDSSMAGTALWLICMVVVICAFVGDQLGYEIGKRSGDIQKIKSWMQGGNADRLDRAKRFFDKHGGKAIVFARFVPILRTFVPFAIGMAGYDHRRFAIANFVGALIWGITVPVMGYLLGRIPLIADHVEMVCLLIVLVSIIPLLIKAVAARLSYR